MALGTPVDLWLGVEGETDEERAARLDAARDILADPEYSDLADDLVRLAARVVEDHLDLFNVVPLVRPTHRRPARQGVAA
ncbi:putative RNA polymerase sigma factor [Streptomyces malaysiensis subsp. malaysiensis]|nr:putative RNA polymerase sigma factor [Streptomyces malaysiensis]